MRGPLKPGTSAPRSGHYEQVGSRGGRTGEEAHRRSWRNAFRHAQAGMGYVLVDPTKNGSGRSGVGAPPERRRFLFPSDWQPRFTNMSGTIRSTVAPSFWRNLSLRRLSPI